MKTQVDLFHVDVLPARAAVQAEIAVSPKGSIRARFRAERKKRSLLGRPHFELSEWSGWFQYDGDPIELHWDTFWIELR